ncbi:phosphatidate cytidylyltransferase 1-like [Salvelinus namaycush]|uniref:Phosphatidate cytidylyltransferase 1-like n=1 Tax=Salvelinus namaycush TaxID=8040 RepID=A0A8U0UK98_SALNM|nr:phosphatidate cytidylyltransferase 1-like [Salvelinus namaycush]
MTELRKRGGGGDPDSVSDKEADGEDRLDLPGEAGGDCDGEYKADTPCVPPSTADNTPQFLKEAVEGLNPRWKNCCIRGVLSMAMISGFFMMIYLGPIMLIVVVCSFITCS